MQFPRHEASLTLEHNPHKDFYQTVEQWDKGQVSRGRDVGWVNEDQKQKAYVGNDVWVLQWYPNTPIGFNLMAACDLDVLLSEACRG